MLEWTRRILLGALVLVALAISAGFLYERWARRNVAREYPPPGRLVEHDGRRSHLLCSGEGPPTVVLDAGLGVTGVLAWTDVQPDVAAFSRVCSYDRAGIMWSEPRAEPRDAHRIGNELHGILKAASESPPFVLVGHSVGGLLVRVYTDRYPDEVAGLVLVDAAHPEQFERYPAEVLEYRTQLDSSLPPQWIMKDPVDGWDLPWSHVVVGEQPAYSLSSPDGTLGNVRGARGQGGDVRPGCRGRESGGSTAHGADCWRGA